MKLSQKNVPKNWSINRWDMWFSEIEKITCDLHILGGDIFDKLPSLEELQLFFKFVIGTSHNTIIYDGNHEASKKGKTFLSLLKPVVTELNPKVRIVDCVEVTEEYQIVPYCELHNIESIVPLLRSDLVLFSHFRGEIPPHVKPELDLDIFNKFDVVVAGDLHSHKNTQRNIVYPGSVMTTSFHREISKGSNGYLLIDTNQPKNWIWNELTLPQLIRKTITNQNEAVPTNFHYTVYEMEGDISSVGKITNELVTSKKLTTDKTNTESILPVNASIDQELDVYLRKVLKHNNPDKVLKYFHDNFKNFRVV